MINRTAPQPRLVSLFGEKGASWLMSRAGQKSLVTEWWLPPGVQGGSFVPYGTYGGNIDYAAEAGRLDHNSIVMIACQWIMRNGVASRLRVMERTPGGEPQEVLGHPLTKLLEKPNPWYSGRILRQGSLFSLNTGGFGYWLKRRNALREPVQLWYEPHWTMRPVWDDDKPDEFIGHYQIFRKGKWLTEPQYRIKPEDVVHFRFGMDPDNLRQGLNPLKTSLREIYTDNQAARYTAAMLRNNGVPGPVFSPKSEEVHLSREDGLEIKAAHQANFTGDHVGEALVLGHAMDVHQYAFDPKSMLLPQMRDKPEERIPALMGLNAVVLGLGVGLKQSSYNNITEAGVDAYENNIFPAEMVFADELRTQLLPDFGNNEAQYIDFDWSEVPFFKRQSGGQQSQGSVAEAAQEAKPSQNGTRSGNGQDREEELDETEELVGSRR